jgi:MtrB/PioB family decaheme-associated outer membrane protein
MTMKKIIIALTFAIGLFIASQALAEEQTLAGEVSIKGMLTDVNGNRAKFNEYRDLQDGAYGHVKLLYDTDAWWLKGDAADFGYDTQRYDLQGGLWGAFKADLFYREIPHNITFGASNPQTFPASFDYSTLRRQTGGSFSLDVIKPFFFNVSATSELRKGNKPSGTSLDSVNTTAMEIPGLIDYRTNIVKADFGYSQKPFFADLYFMYSDFDSKNNVQDFFNQTSAATEQLTLPPDNKYYKVGFKGAVKLPYNSKLNVNGGWSETTSTADLQNTDQLLLAALSPSNLTFRGKVDTTNLDVVLVSNPVTWLDGKIFYKYYDRDNKSDVITQTESAIFNFTNKLFDYQKNEFGGELGFRLPMKFYLSTGYVHTLTNRPLDTLADTTDDTYTIDLRWKGLDFMTVRTGYERLVRNADFHTPVAVGVAFINPSIPVAGARNFDLADKTRDTIKLSVDLYPTDYLSIGVGYKHKETNYKQLLYGLKSDRSDEVFTNADLTVGRYAQLFGYFDYQQTRRNMDQCDGSFGPCVGTSADIPLTWNLKEKETYYDFGLGTNIFLMPKKLTMRLQYDYSKNNGNQDLTLGSTLFGAGSALPATANQNNIDVPNWDDYTKQTLMAKFIYDVTKHISFAIGYAYEKFKYSDAQLNGYQLIPTDGGAFLTGAYANQSYNANIYFATLTYKFW